MPSSRPVPRTIVLALALALAGCTPSGAQPAAGRTDEPPPASQGPSPDIPTPSTGATDARAGTAVSTVPRATLGATVGATIPPSATTASGPLAPELDGDAWLQSPPLRMADLRGKVVIVDFWTFGCINCIRTFPAIRALHDRYTGTDVVLISVHSPEFDRERDIDAVRDAVTRFDIDYPVVIDNTWSIWRGFDNRAWPALYLVAKDGRIRGSHIGELHIDTPTWDAWIERIEALRAEVTAPTG